MSDTAAKKKKKRKAPPPRKPQVSTAPVQAAASGKTGTGNTIDFQFAEYQMVQADYIDHDLVLTPKLPKKFQKIQKKYIYAFALGPRYADQIPFLVKEYRADEIGALSFIDGSKRRFREPSAATNWVSVPAASLPLIVNGKPARYAFVVGRGRFSAGAILDMESGLHPTYHPMYLGDPQYFKQGDDKAWYLSVVDALTFAEQLGEAFKGACIEYTNYTTPNDQNKGEKSTVEERNARYQLARMIKDTLLAPDGDTVTDPLHIREGMQNNGQVLLDEVKDSDSTLRTKSEARRNAAIQLVRYYKSGLWKAAHRWHLGPQANEAEIGQYWIDTFGRSLDRLGEVPEGRKFEKELLDAEMSGNQEMKWVQYLFHPEEAAGPDALERWRQIYPIGRKAATGVVLGICEMAPALIVHGKVQAANKRIVATLKAFLEHVPIRVDFAAIGPGGFVQGVLQYQQPVVRIEVEWKAAKPDVEKWLHEGKGVWPQHAKLAEPAELISRLLIGVETINFFNKLSEMVDILNHQPPNPLKKHNAKLEAAAALLDLVVACEEPLLHYAHQFAHGAGHGASHGAHAAEAAGHASEAEGAAAIAAGKKEAKSLLGEALSGPVVFKAIGVASAAIDAWVYYHEAGEAAAKGQSGVAMGDYLIAGGSALMAVASVVNAAGYIATAGAAATDGALATGAFLGAAGATLLVVGVVIAAVGFLVVALMTKDAWRIFIEHTLWGNTPAEAGFDTWSGGNFSEWTQDKNGYERQIQVLTAMLCSYRVHANGQNAEAITITFGSLPPGAVLEIAFSFDYADGTKRRFGYTIEVETRNVTDVRGDAAHFVATGPLLPGMHPFWSGERLSGLEVVAPRMVKYGTRMRDASCTVVLRYARNSPNAPVMKGTIPTTKQCAYKILEDSGGVHTDELNSLEIGEEEGGGEDEGGGEPEASGADESSHAE